ncbi:hypothetical protein PO878_03960 [Iamia majanohamensis]|uniref:Uncharacterized protein n=1 Tax=Iamia majanohamensis TaxID=467976 RepID=A0AAE9YB49_9ACTN|nr:hypothetical protein [Iamia majanohamensis]WCO67878.1 hypothetical protein PO878_03960 [Iamia majanohamensis]
MAYPTASDIRAKVPVLDKVPLDEDVLVDLIEELVAEFQGIAEEYRGVAYVPRTATDVFPRASTDALLLTWPQVTAVTGVTVDGTSLTVDELADVTTETWGRLYRPVGWHGDITVTYTHGLAETPPAVTRACREFVRAKVLEQTGNGPRNVTSYQDDSGWSYRESTPDWAAGRPTGLQVVDAALNSLPDHRVPGVG